MAARKDLARKTAAAPQRARSKLAENATANRDWHPEFLAALAKYGVVQYACDAIGVNRSTVYRHRSEDAGFAVLWDEACEVAWDRLEQEAFRRAVEGTPEPLVSGGRVVRDEAGEIVYVLRFSDALMQTMLKAKRPGTYRERTDVHHSGSVGITLTAMAKMADEYRHELESGDDNDTEAT